MKSPLKDNNLQILQLDYYGLVAVACKELGIAEKINKRLCDKIKNSSVQPGEVVVSMILNGLGFPTQKLCLAPEFLKGKPVSLLLGKNIHASHLTAAIHEAVLEEIANYDTNCLFTDITSESVTENNLLSPRARLENVNFTIENKDSPKDEHSYIHVTHEEPEGPSDFYQHIIMSMVMSGESNLPIWMMLQMNRNSNQAEYLRTIELITKFQAQTDQKDTPWIWMMNSTVYTNSKLLNNNKHRWIVRVPDRISQAKKLIEITDDWLEWCNLKYGYKYSEHESNWPGVKKRVITRQLNALKIIISISKCCR